MPPTADKDVAFFEKAETRGAGAFGLQFKNLAMSDIARMGHAFRLVQHDPTATSVAAQTLPTALAKALGLSRSNRKAVGTRSVSKTTRASGKAAKRRTRR